MKKRLFAAILSVVMLGGLVTVPVRAAETITYTTVEETARALTAQLRARTTDVTVTFDMDSTTDEIKALGSRIYDVAIAHNGNPDEGDYLYMSILHQDVKMNWQVKNNVRFTGTFAYHMDYADATAQEAEATSAVNAAMASLNLNGKSEYEKVRAIYNYICDNVTYDYNHNNLSHSAYAAIVKKSAVCQGYSALFYRMAMAAGLDARCITGWSNNENHGWNIVRIDGKYYNIDSTWGAKNNREDFFLKGVNFADHRRDAQYASAEFNAAYPMSDTDYAAPVKVPDSGNTPAAPASGSFTDVQSSDWFAADVKRANELNLINGLSPTVFAPHDPLTAAQAVKLAAAMHQSATTGSVTLGNDPGTWYMSYVNYAKNNGIISKDYDWDASITRAGYMEIFANALPDSSLSQINNIPDGSIPDVPMSHPQAAAIYKLYRAGILNGTGDTHACEPSANIERCAVAAILVRMMEPGARKQFSMN